MAAGGAGRQCRQLRRPDVVAAAASRLRTPIGTATAAAPAVTRNRSRRDQVDKVVSSRTAAPERGGSPTHAPVRHRVRFGLPFLLGSSIDTATTGRRDRLSSLVELRSVSKGIRDERDGTNERRCRAWHQTACILCSVNCGLEVRIDGPTITRVRGDKAHPASEGYTCEKGLRIDHYQNSPHRLTTPLRRRPDGTFEAIDWDTAIAEVAQRFQDVIAEHGGDKILFYGGGGQGNHLGGGYGGATRSALGIRYTSNALAQEKTGEFWVDGQLFGRSRCHTAPDFEHAEVGVFWGKNPWQSHGIQQARRILKEFANDPARTLIVVDPRRTESADLADIHLRPLPGGDAHLLAAMLAILVAGRPARRRLAGRARQRARRVGRPPAHDRHRRVVRQGRRRRGRRAPRRARDRHGHRRRVGARGPRHPDGAALDAQQLPREAARAPHRQPRRAGRRQHPLALRRPARRRRRQPRPRPRPSPVTGS